MIVKLASPLLVDADLAVDMNKQNVKKFFSRHGIGYIGSWFGWGDEEKTRQPEHWFVIGGRLILVIEEL